MKNKDTLKEHCLEKLEAYEKRYKILFESSRDAIMLLYKKTSFVDGNKAAFRLFNCKTKQSFLSKSPAELSPKYQPDGQLSTVKALKMMDIAMQKGSHFFEWVHKRVGGKSFPATVLLTRVTIKKEHFLQATVRDVSDRKRLQYELTLFRYLMDHSSEAMFVIDTITARLVDANITAEKMLGLTRKQILGKKIMEIDLITTNMKQWQKRIKRIERTKEATIESIYKTKRGRTFPVEISVKYIQNEQEDGKNRPFLVATVRDITDKKKTENKFKLFRNLLDNASDSLFIIEPKTGQILDANATAAKKLGYSMEKFLKKHVFDLDAVVGDLSKWKKEVALIKRDGGALLERMHKRADGTFIPVEINTKYIFVQGYYIVATVRDISERKKSYEQIRKFKRIADQASYGAAILDMKGKVSYLNDSFAKMHGYTKEEMLDENILAFHKKGEKSERLNGDKKLLKNGKYSAKEVWHKTKKGKIFPVLMTTSVIRDDNGKALYLSVTAIDITQQKEYEKKIIESQNLLKKKNKALTVNQEKLRKTIEALEKAHKELQGAQAQLVQSEKLALLGQLAAGIAHEINNPIGFISSNMETLVEYIKGYSKMLSTIKKVQHYVKSKKFQKATEAVKKAEDIEKRINLKFIQKDVSDLLQETKRGVYRIKNIVKDLSVFSREDKGEMAYNSIEKIAESVITIIANEVKYKGFLKKQYKKMPPLWCNAQKIGQVFMNLLANATQAIKGTGEIFIKTYKKNKMAVVEISDTGEGIEKKNMEKLFDPFFTTKDVGKGTGLGLSISYDIIKQHKGDMTVTSQKNKGTKVILKIPYLKEKNVRKKTSNSDH